MHKSLYKRVDQSSQDIQSTTIYVTYGPCPEGT